MDWTSRGVGPPGSEQVLADLQRQLGANPADLIAMHNLAVELRMLDRIPEALAMADKAWHAGLHIPETATTRGHDLADLGRFAEAAECYRQALAIDPTHVSAHEALAALLPQSGEANAALDSYEAALKLAPGSVPLWTSALNTANGQQRFDRLEAWSQAAMARFGQDPVLVGYLACAEAGQGHLERARATIGAALARQPDYAVGQLIQARIALALGDAKEAEEAALRATRLAPQDQLGWTLLSTAWRLRDDPREHWLCRYDELVMPIDLDLPAGLEAALNARHRAAASPAEQSLRHGTQTPGNLFHRTDPQVQRLAQDLLIAIETRLAALSMEPDHPFLARNTGRIGFSASWSVRLTDQGHHASHMHPAGWLSSACYIAVPPEVGQGAEQGALTFGAPDQALGLNLAPRRIVQPAVGRLVIFPSYLWHGTVPFRSDQPRLTVAFDAVPIQN